ncbi:MAG: 3-dehydroquinate synthase [Candidatus Heimdallarchaeota archaeon LC_2]|nr:MAG: 3-dehydroquinate synthase [Candidatus Heimdallarchaeota archaeon LC_2]
MYNLFISSSSLNSILIDESKIKGNIDGIFVDSPENKLIESYPLIPKYFLKNNHILDYDGNQIGKKIEITDPKAMEEALIEEVKDGILLVETLDWKIIPLENLIAKYDGSEVKIIAHANSVEDFKILKGILEIGVGGIVISPDSEDELYSYFDSSLISEEKITLESFEVSSIEPIGMGDRACVDTNSILRKGEGMLVGSTSQLFVLVEAEVHKSGYVNPRPFRVNAGVVSLYTLNGQKTNYLSELEAGSEVSIVDRNGQVRKERIARVKIERRPMILVKLKYDQREYSVVLQDAETVRLVNNEGSLPINEIKVGMMVFGHISKSARHFGMKVDEFVEEK